MQPVTLDTKENEHENPDGAHIARSTWRHGPPDWAASVNPKSDLPENQTPAMARFKKDAAAQKALANTVKLADMKAGGFDTVFYPGGHGPMWDLAESPTSTRASGVPTSTIPASQSHWYAIRAACFAT